MAKISIDELKAKLTAKAVAFPVGASRIELETLLKESKNENPEAEVVKASEVAEVVKKEEVVSTPIKTAGPRYKIVKNIKGMTIGNEFIGSDADYEILLKTNVIEEI